MAACVLAVAWALCVKQGCVTPCEGICAQRTVLRSVGPPDSPTKWTSRALGRGWGTSLQPLTCNTPWGKQRRPPCMPCRAVSASVQGGGRAWPPLFPMATAQLCVEAARCGLWLATRAGSQRGPGAPHPQPRFLPGSLPPRHPPNYFNPWKRDRAPSVLLSGALQLRFSHPGWGKKHTLGIKAGKW